VSDDEASVDVVGVPRMRIAWIVFASALWLTTSPAGPHPPATQTPAPFAHGPMLGDGTTIIKVPTNHRGATLIR